VVGGGGGGGDEIAATAEPATPAETLSDDEYGMELKDAAGVAVHEEGTPTCHLCGASFESAGDQRAHFRLDWHRFNVQRRARGQGPVDEDAFDLLVGADDAGSISGSDDDSDAELARQASVGPKSPRVCVQGEDGEKYMMWRTLLPWMEDADEGEVCSITHTCLCVIDAACCHRFVSGVRVRH